MKKIVLYISTMMLLASLLAGCTQQEKWKIEEQQQLRKALNSYREMIYLEALNDAEFTLFVDNITANLETQYPVYASFVAMPGVSDTVDFVVVETIVEQLDADARNMRNIFPYNNLVAQGVLPAGISADQKHSFYRCLAGKINTTYSSTAQFFSAILSNSVDGEQLRGLQAQCASDLFQWTATEIDIIEESNN